MKQKAFKAAFPKTIPIFTGFCFLGAAYGIYARSAGLDFWYPILTSVVVYGGSLEFLAVEMLTAPFAPLQSFFMALLIQARHIFYGISMLDKFSGTGAKKPYLIFAMCDETFSVNYSSEVPEGVDKGWFMFFVTLLDQLYWIGGAALGSLAGSVLPFDTTGISFVMTAMFTVIFSEQWLKESNHSSSLIGLICTVCCRLIFGAESFILPAMAAITASLLIMRKIIEPKETEK